MSEPENACSRREFVKLIGVAAGAAGIGACGVTGGAARVDLPKPAAGSAASKTFPALNARARGWLRFVWEKATTKDDWTSTGQPHEWWDQYTAPGVLSYPRFDLNESTYAILMMADQTPAWREVYTRIMDELAGRYPTYWGAVDWLTQIGDDPNRASYPPAIMNRLPEQLRGRYNRIGWVANGVAPYGLQPDPLGADGNLFYRGWFNLVLSAYRYVSGDDKWEKPFTIVGYQDREFQWTQRQIVERLEKQWAERPEGLHCENTKIWPYCLSAAGLGLYLYDSLHGTRAHRIYENWLEYCKDHYMGMTADGKLEWFTSFYDPVVNYKLNGGATAGIGTAFHILPQNREIASLIYEAAVTRNRWNDPQAPVTNLSPAAVIMARELGDHSTLARLSAAAEREFEPRFFGADDSRFGWWFHLGEKYPRGQRSALMMVADVGTSGDWIRTFQVSHLDKFDAPTVQGVDYPALGISQAWNDVESGVLHVSTYVGSSDRRGLATSWRVTRLPNARRVSLRCDGQPFSRFHVEGSDTIRIDDTIDAHRFEIVTGYRGRRTTRDAARDGHSHATGSQLATPSMSAMAAGVSLSSERALVDLLPGCPCCGS